jgi:aryl-alcohol dehydrogenase-like predicted oxidoreductase
MQTHPLGSTDLQVSRIILGCGNFGGIGSSPAFFGKGISKEDAFALMNAAWEYGITTFDTADAYGGGRSETFIGEWLATKPTSVNDALVLATKTYNPMNDGHDRGLAAARIVRQIETSLVRLGVERVAMYLAHEFDPEASIVETMTAFDTLVRAGKVGAVGASNFSSDQLQRSLAVSAESGLRRYEWVQNSFSLLERGDASSVLPMCESHGLGYMPFSPLAGGWLTGKYRRDAALPVGSRMTLRPEPYAAYRTEKVFTALESLEDASHDHGCTMAALALAWTMAQPGITAIVIGPNNLGQLAAVLEAVDLTLAPSDFDHLSELFSCLF